jgi:hypothetical protein
MTWTQELRLPWHRAMRLQLPYLYHQCHFPL